MQISKSLLRCGVAQMIEPKRVIGQSTEHPIESEEPDPEVLIHESIIVQRVVVDIMQSPRSHKPMAEDWRSSHPEILDMHPVMQVAKHQEAPHQNRPDRDGLIGQRNSEQVESSDGNE